MSNHIFTLYDSTTQTPEDLLNTITGSAAGISIVQGSVNYVGADEAVSTFDSFNFGEPVRMDNPGILLTSGDGAPPLSNTESAYTISHGLGGDPEFTDLAQNAFNGAGTTNDASILEFDFTVQDSSVQSVSFDLIFGSEEYPNFIDSSFVDIAGVLVNGTNYGLFNGDPQKPLSVIGNNVSSGSLLDNGTGHSTGSLNSPFNTIYDIEYNGISPRLTVSVPLDGSSLYSVRIGVADTGDHVLDSGLFVSNFTTSSSNAGGLLVNVEASPEGGELLPAGDDTSTLFIGKSGNDIMVGSTAPDVYDLTAGGSNTIKGGKEQLNGDTIKGFDEDDIILYEGAFFTNDDLIVTEGSAILNADTDGDGQADTQTTLEGVDHSTDFNVVQTNEGTQIAINNVTPSKFFLGSDTQKVVVTGSFELRPLTGVSYSNIDVVMDNVNASVDMSLSIANNSTLTLNPDGNYDFSVNLDTGTVDITNTDTGNLVTALPVDDQSMTTPLVRIGEGSASSIAVDPNDLTIDQNTLPVAPVSKVQLLSDSSAATEMFASGEGVDEGSSEASVFEGSSEIDSSSSGLAGVYDGGQEMLIA